MSRTILTIAAAVLVMTMPAWGAEDVDTANSICGGTIPETCQMALSGTGVAALLTLGVDGACETAYDAGFIESAADAVIATLDANKKWELSVKYDGSGWSCPGAYDKAESDLQLRISNTPTGTVQHSADSYFAPVAGDTFSILTHTAGVSDNVVNMQSKVLLSWTADVPGVYSITLVYTMETTA